MKVERVTSIQFKPIELILTIESQEELDSLREISGSDKKVTEACMTNKAFDKSSAEGVRKVLSAIWKALKD